MWKSTRTVTRTSRLLYSFEEGRLVFTQDVCYSRYITLLHYFLEYSPHRLLFVNSYLQPYGTTSSPLLYNDMLLYFTYFYISPLIFVTVGLLPAAIAPGVTDSVRLRSLTEQKELVFAPEVPLVPAELPLNLIVDPPSLFGLWAEAASPHGAQSHPPWIRHPLPRHTHTQTNT